MLRTLAATLLLAALAAPATAQATLVFDRSPADHPTVWIAADDGSGARKLADGASPRIAPDGKMVVYSVIADQRTFRPDLLVVPADGRAAPRTLLRAQRDPGTFAWSPDGTTIAAVTGPEIGPRKLVLVDVATGARRTLATGFFWGVSFSGDGTQLVYARARHSRYPAPADVFRAGVAPGSAPPARVTHDGRSIAPLFGAGKIVFARFVDAKRRRYGPKTELYTITPDGRNLRRLTVTNVDPLLSGLQPTELSGDGRRLLAEFTGQDTSYAETVDMATGRHRPLPRALERGLVGTRLSDDGTTVLGATGGYDPSSRHDVVTIPYGGGTPSVLARDAADPDWTR